MIQEYINEVRLFEYFFGSVNFHNEQIKQRLLTYINKYLQYKKLSANDLKLSYESFLRQYSKDVKYFLESNQYPAISSDYKHNVGREEYDIALLLSTIFSQHRFDIMYEINNSVVKSERALVVGCGIGLEIDIIKRDYDKLDAYDIELDNFCHDSHPEVNFFETAFTGDKEKFYNDVFIIELLEHVPEPYSLIGDAADVIGGDGRILITLAIDIPQFDHVINFDDKKLFLTKVDELGLYVEYEREIKHSGQMNGLSTSSNIFMILKRKF